MALVLVAIAAAFARSALAASSPPPFSVFVYEGPVFDAATTDLEACCAARAIRRNDALRDAGPPGQLTLPRVMALESEDRLGKYHPTWRPRYRPDNPGPDMRGQLQHGWGAVWMHQAMLQHPARTRSPDNATVFFVPAYVELSVSCAQDRDGLGNETRHLARMAAVADAIEGGPYGRLLARHIITATGPDVRHLLLTTRLGVLVADGGGILLNAETWGKPKHSGNAKVPGVTSGFPDAVGRIRMPYAPLPALTTLAARRRVDADAELARRRPITFFIQGALARSDHRVRWTRALLRVPDVHMINGVEKYHMHYAKIQRRTALMEGLSPEDQARVEGKPLSTESYVNGIFDATFCPILEGDTCTSRRLFDAIAAGCIPVVHFYKCRSMRHGHRRGEGILSSLAPFCGTGTLEYPCEDWAIVLPRLDGNFKSWKCAARSDHCVVLRDGKEYNFTRADIIATMANALLELPFETVVALRRGLRRARQDLVYGAGNPFRDDEQDGGDGVAENAGRRIFGSVATHVLRAASKIIHQQRPQRRQQDEKYLRKLREFRKTAKRNKFDCKEMGDDCTPSGGAERLGVPATCRQAGLVCWCGWCETPQEAARRAARTQRRAAREMRRGGIK